MPKPPRKVGEQRSLDTSANDIDQFLESVASTPLANAAAAGKPGSLIFALDATASRQATWDIASSLQADMFTKSEGLASLELQLVYYRGYQECKASPWLNNANALLRMMNKIDCVAGRTQIARVLKHAIAEAKRKPVQAAVFIGDAMEENVDELGELAGQLSMLQLPVFIFQEGQDPMAGMAFKQIAKLSGGAHCRFDHNAAQQLGQLLNAVAVYAAGGQNALKKLSQQGSKQATLMLDQLN